jgi:prepilin-type N-terminal cleavage/methylation domain-containing protein
MKPLGDRLRPHSRTQRGFTLIEMIMSAGLIGLLALTATFFWVHSFTLVRMVNSDSVGVAEGRAVLERLAREIREVKLDIAAGAYCVSTMSATRMVFNRTSGSYANGCGGAAPTAANNDIAVTIDLPNGSTTLNMGYAGALAAPAQTRALTATASAFGIRYLDLNYDVTNNASALRFVELSLTVTPPSAPATQTRTVVALRNF